MDERTEVVDRVAEALFVAWTSAAIADVGNASQFTAETAYAAALVFYEERERRRGEWERQRKSEDPVSLESHDFQPAQGDPDTCLVCAKRRHLHPKQEGANG